MVDSVGSSKLKLICQLSEKSFRSKEIMMAGEVIATEKAPGAIGPYSQAIKISGYLFTAGQSPRDPVTGKIVDGGIEEQSHQVMKNLSAVLT